MGADTKAETGGPTWVAPLAANLLVGLVLLVAAVLESADSDLYYRSAQEDGALEWMTFWAFMVAAAVFVVAGRRRHRSGGTWPWFAWGVAAFCVFVAMEEISWGQRLLGYRPPEYFLRENFQQELNIHNVFSTSLRKFLLKAVILGYGVVLPLLALPRAARRGLERAGVLVPPAALAPAFFLTFWTYETYPWSFSGEWVELMLGLGFLFAALSHLGAGETEAARAPWRLRPLLAASGVVAVLGVAAAGLSQLRPADTPAMTEAARTELEALARDFMAGGRLQSRCGIHKRVYSFVEKYRRRELQRGEFSRLTTEGMPSERAEYFLDPWNSPIWIRHKCRDSKRRQRAFVYSFGPDRRRDSSSWQLRGDDIGIVIFERGL